MNSLTEKILNKFHRISNIKHIEESFHNLFSVDDKRKYANEVYEILQQSYAPIGGIKGNGFNDIDDMIKNIPFWKIHKNKNGRIDALMLYKDKHGRKSVASGTDGSVEGKRRFKEMIIAEFDRSYREVSDGMWRFIQKSMTTSEILKYAISYDDAFKLTGGKIARPENVINDAFSEFYYDRNIGGKLHTKIMLGTPNLSIK